MGFAAAIFDCDGTILDSMPMWQEMCVGLLERYGVEDALEVFLENESLDMDKKCYHYHEALGIGESGEALYRELWQMVEEAYRKTVRPYPGVHEFLQRLKDEGIECVVASSTPPALLESALTQHGLRHFFSRVVFCGDVGRGKSFPDVYLACERMLGTPRADTWVFEDAPFGIRSAARAGFPVVGILNDHDGRDEDFVRLWSRVVATDYDMLDTNVLKRLAPKTLDVLIVADSPEPSSKELVRTLATTSDLVLAADRGADVLLASGITPAAIVGDLDTASDATRKLVEAGEVPCVRFSPEKDDTDLSLAVAHARECADGQGASLRLTLTCAAGGRPDHALGVWGVLARARDISPRLVEDGFECRILSPEGAPSWRFDGDEGAALSVVALANDTVVSERGTRWELDHNPLELLSDLGISNRITAAEAEVCCHAGAVAVFRFKSDQVCVAEGAANGI